MSKEMRDSMKLLQAMKRAKIVHQELTQLLEQANEIVSEVDPTKLAPGQAGDYGFIHQLAYEARSLDRLMSYYVEADFLSGRLVQMDSGRYCINGNKMTELYSGSMIQYLDDETGVYYTSRVEHDSDRGYYIDDLGPETPIDGLVVRQKY